VPKPPVPPRLARSMVRVSTAKRAGCFLDVAVSSTTVARHPLAAAAATGASPYGAAASTSDLGFCAISLDDKPLSPSALALSPRSRTVVEALMRHPRG